MELFIQDNITKFLFYFPKKKAFGIFLCDNDHIVASRESVFMTSKKFPDLPFDPIPFYCIPCLLAYGYPQSVNVKPVMLKNDRKVRCMISFS